jgi:hypothetical protein
VFGARKKPLDALTEEKVALLQQIEQLQQVNTSQVAQIQDMLGDLQRFGALDHRAREVEYAQLQSAIAADRDNFERQRIEQQRQFDADRGQQHQRLEADRTSLAREIERYASELAGLKQHLIPFTEEAVFQDAGIFRYHHPLDNAEAYKDSLTNIQFEMKEMARAGDAVHCSTTFSYNNSAAQGRRLAKDLSKLMLRLGRCREAPVGQDC